MGLEERIIGISKDKYHVFSHMQNIFNYPYLNIYNIYDMQKAYHLRLDEIVRKQRKEFNWVI